MQFFKEKKVEDNSNWQDENWEKFNLQPSDYARVPKSYEEYCDRAKYHHDISMYYKDIEENLDDLTIEQRIEICRITVETYQSYLQDADNIDISKNKFNGERLADWIGLKQTLEKELLENDSLENSGIEKHY